MLELKKGKNVTVAGFVLMSYGIICDGWSSQLVTPTLMYITVKKTGNTYLTKICKRRINGFEIFVLLDPPEELQSLVSELNGGPSSAHLLPQIGKSIYEQCLPLIALTFTLAVDTFMNDSGLSQLTLTKNIFELFEFYRTEIIIHHDPLTPDVSTRRAIKL
jgi:hypothetical protein